EGELGIDVPVVLHENGVLPIECVARHEARNTSGGEVGLGDQHVGDFVAAVPLLEAETVAEEVETFAELRAFLTHVAAHDDAAELERVVALQPRYGVRDLHRPLLDSVLAEIAEVLDVGAVAAPDDRDAVRCGDPAGAGDPARLVLVSAEAHRKEREMEVSGAGAQLVYQVGGK